ncbi:hypothetical protein OEV98_06170 [Caldibacillus lycopersici]|uniref:DUF4083 domain-containing protein n=1 Tax=Perspicuibacillus lycopersici TaxID=1325689 RepID=A0AAE3LMP4_9BACI|nr:hypothetical protein [Perspicuibacillus lycopersici]MCU9613136.1 hypothetical protein [Perspicuibacillus lycopersici]
MDGGFRFADSLYQIVVFLIFFAIIMLIVGIVRSQSRRQKQLDTIVKRLDAISEKIDRMKE